MKQVSELLEVGMYETFKPERTMTVRDLLRELGLEGKYLGVLVDGKKATEDMDIDEDSEVVILPHIAGGEKEINPVNYIQEIEGLKSEIEFLQKDIRKLENQKEEFRQEINKQARILQQIRDLANKGLY